MKKSLVITTVIITLVVTVLLPFKSNEVFANPLLRVVGGSVAERVIVGIGEKAGMKYATESARKRAVQRWNLDLIEKYEKETAENKILYENLLNRLNNATVTPIPDKPGFGKVILDTAAVVTGADILFEGYKAFENAKNAGVVAEVIAEGDQLIDSGAGFTTYGTYHFYVVEGLLAFGSNELYGTGLIEAVPPVYAYITNITDNGTTLTFGIKAVNGLGQVFSDRKDGVKSIANYDGYTKQAILPTNFPGIINNILPDLSPIVEQPGINIKPELPSVYPKEVEIIVPLDPFVESPEVTEPWNDPGIGEPIPEQPPLEEPQPKLLPNPEYKPELPPSLENPVYIENPKYDPFKPMPGDPTKDLDPITGDPPTTGGPTTPGEYLKFKPWLLLLGFLDLLRAIVFYLLRMVEYILTLPMLPMKEIPTYTDGFKFFKELTVKGVNVFSIVMMMFNFALGFMVYKVIQKIFNSSGG